MTRHTISGVNDLATIAGTSLGAVTEDGTLTTGGTLSVSDVDFNENKFQTVAAASLAGAYGTFMFNEVSGAWTYALNNASVAVQALNNGQSLADSLIVTSLDGTATQTIAVTINGVTDNVVISNGNGGGTVTGTGGNDVIDAAGGNDVVNAGAGNDRNTGGTGADIVNAGAGDDTIVATIGDGSDVYDGSSGTDTIDYSAITAALNINLNSIASSGQTGVDVLRSIENATGGSGNDRITGNGGNNVLDGGAGADRLEGGGGNDTLIGGAGIDRLEGGAGRDVLEGGSEADSLDGGAGNDILIGGTGDDVLTGGIGSDTFVFAPFSGDDAITDFDANPAGGQDFIDVSGYGITLSTFVSRVSVANDGRDTLITIDTDDTIRLQGINNASTVTVSDFLFV